MPKKFSSKNIPTKDAVARFKMLLPMLESLLQEVREFSKKKPDGALNSFKVKMINKTLSDIKDILAQDPSSQYLELMDNDSLPQNSDAVLMLGQYLAAMNHFKEKHSGYNGISYGWNTTDGFIEGNED